MGPKLNGSRVVEPSKQGGKALDDDEPNGFDVIRAILMQPLSGCFNHGSSAAEKAKKVEIDNQTSRLSAELDEERERHAFTSARLLELQKKQSDTLEQAYVLHRDLEHVMIERDTLKSALSSIFQANKMVKKDILHVDESQDIGDSPILSGISTPSRRTSMDVHDFPFPRSPTPCETLRTVRESLLSRASLD